MAPGDLDKALCGLNVYRDANVIAGFEGAEDAGVYKMTEETAIVNSLDFFTPIVDDPYMFGQIAVANSLSDIYAMGASPICAMNIVAFPSSGMDLSVLHDILRGGTDKLREAGVSLIGGHSIEDAEIKYGVAVTGTVHPKKVLYNSTARGEDSLILTKPLGTGIVNTGIKKGKVGGNLLDEVQKSMAALNRAASEAMRNFTVHACTDVTGFGLLGHLAEMIESSQVGARLILDEIPYFSGALELAREKLVPGGTHKNRSFREHMVEFSDKIPQEYSHLLYDPQTSGGLLIAVNACEAQKLLESLREHGVKHSKIIGKIVTDTKKIIVQRANDGC